MPGNTCQWGEKWETTAWMWGCVLWVAEPSEVSVRCRYQPFISSLISVIRHIATVVTKGWGDGGVWGGWAERTVCWGEGVCVWSYEFPLETRAPLNPREDAHTNIYHSHDHKHTCSHGPQGLCACVMCVWRAPERLWHNVVLSLFDPAVEAYWYLEPETYTTNIYL